ncbi:MAG: hypothetical protein U1E65_27380 [Myxococcota bacterium]
MQKPIPRPAPRSTQPKALAHRPSPKKPTPPPVHPAAADLRAYVIAEDAEGPSDPASEESLAKVRALTVAKSALPRPQIGASLAEARAYARADLFAVAEIGYHYLMNGGTRLALTIFEGLAAIAPSEAYFQLALGLAHDHLQDRGAALKAYGRAAELDPGDPRADLNRAELYLLAKDPGAAKPLLRRALDKAERRADQALSRKARALINHLSAA